MVSITWVLDFISWPKLAFVVAVKIYLFWLIIEMCDVEFYLE